MKNSWRREAALLLILILVSAVLYFTWTSFNVTAQIRRTVEEENGNSLRLWAADTESRLNTIYEHIHELLLTLYNSNEIRTGTPIMNASTKRKILDMMEEKLIVSEDTDAFFVFDTENDFYLFQAKPGLDSREAHTLKDYLREEAAQKATAYRNTTWEVTSIGGEDCFAKGVRLGKYVVGAVSGLEHYRIDDKFSVLGGKACCLLVSGEHTSFVGGDWDYSVNLPGMTAPGRIRVTADCAMLNASAVLTSEPVLASSDRIVLPLLLFLNSAAFLVLSFCLLRLLRQKVVRPCTELIHANQELAGGNIDYRLQTGDAGSEEFGALYDSFNTMASQITRLRIEAYDLRLQENKNRLTMLRAQLRPHSFLNAITTISNMTYICEPDEIRDYIGSFARFIRYMLNVNAAWVPLEQELAHIRSYLKMQEMRFPGSILFTVDCDEDTLKHEIPFLVLYTLVENSIKHAMTLYEQLEIRIRCSREDTEAFHGICLIEEDSGEGFSEDAVRSLLEEDAMFTKEHLGLSNVRYTLNLSYHRNDLLKLTNREEGGARVELRIPDREERNEAADL